MEINIIGMGKGKELAPKSGIRWGITRVVSEMPVDAVFDIHDLDLDHIDEKNKQLFLDRLKRSEEIGAKFYSVHKLDSDASVRYPIEEVVSKYKTTYFASSVCYAIALALFKGATSINLFGVNMAKTNKTEYDKEKPCVDYWVGFARGLGVDVKIHGTLSEVEKTKNHLMYGYQIPQEEMLNHVRSL